MAERYDVVVAGAGPAGAQCAREVAEMGYDVLVLEREGADEFPARSDKSTGGTFPAMLSAFDVPDAVVMQFTDRVVFESPNEHLAVGKSGAVLDFAAFKQFLVAAGQDAGAEYRFDAPVHGPVTEDGACVGVRCAGDEVVRADVVVDGTGPAAVVARQLGVTDFDRTTQAVGLEYEFENLALAPDGRPDCRDAMLLRLDHDVAPGGYAWLFHTGDDTGKVGVCFVQNEAHAARAREGWTIDDYLDRWLATDPRFADVERIDGHHRRGSAHLQRPRTLCADGFLAVGDTVPSIDPLWGEGIHKGLRSGRQAAVAVDHALSAGDPSAETLSVYRDLWHESVAPNATARLVLNRLLYLADDDRYDRLLADLRAHPDDLLTEAARRRPRALLDLLHPSDLTHLPRALPHLWRLWRG